MSQKTKLISRFTKRQNKDWQGSDLIRDDLLKAGIGIIDTDKYQIWFRV